VCGRLYGEWCGSEGNVSQGLTLVGVLSLHVLKVCHELCRFGLSVDSVLC